MAWDLSRDQGRSVTIADVREEALRRVSERTDGRVKTIRADLSKPEEIRRIVEPFDVVLGALGSRIGFAALRAVIEAGKNYCDICFMSENPLELDGLAKERGVTAIVDCGVAPGMSNLLVGHAASQLDQTDDVAIYVGGLPVERHWPYNYKAGFSPYDVIEEYVRPARLVERGEVVTKEALSDAELIDVPGLGSLEAVNTDGLRTLVETICARRMREKTLRYPGHYELMRVLRHSGFFSHDPVRLGEAEVRPIDLTAALLFPKWTYEPGEEDLTVMRVQVEGRSGDRGRRFTWDLFDRYDEVEQHTSMSRTTAFPATIFARKLADGSLRRPGVAAPEVLGADGPLVEHVLSELEARGVRYRADFEVF